MTPTATPITNWRDASFAMFSVARCRRVIEADILTTEDKSEPSRCNPD